MNFNSLAFSPICRMNEVKRYSSVYQETEESLAEHICEVSAMSFMIAQEMIKYGQEVNIGTLLTKCLVHDVDEVITGDVPRNTKYASAEVKENLNKVAESAVKLICESSDIDILDIWSNAKEGVEGLILKVVDTLVVAKKAVTEIKLRGNLSFLKVVIELESHLNHLLDKFDHDQDLFNKINDDSYYLLYSLVREALYEIRSIKDENNLTISKYNLRENVIKN